jgi:acyl-CoA reductase-like NAD-dependent aldehyde dehydrogenase
MVPEESSAVREETFGPVVTVTPARRAGMKAARALRAGMTSALNGRIVDCCVQLGVHNSPRSR